MRLGNPGPFQYGLLPGHFLEGNVPQAKNDLEVGHESDDISGVDPARLQLLPVRITVPGGLTAYRVVDVGVELG